MKQSHALVLGVVGVVGITALAASSLAEGPFRKPPATASKQFVATMQTLADAPYLHDGRLLTLEDTVEFFNVVLGTKLSAAEKRDLVSFLRVL